MSGEWASRQIKDKTERVTGLGRRTREVIVKLNKKTALRFQTGWRGGGRGRETMQERKIESLSNNRKS